MKIILVWYQHDWGLYGRRYEMIARTWARLHPGDEILVVEPPLNPWTWFKHTLAALLPLDRGQSRFWLSRLKHVSAGPTRVSHNLWHVQPFLLWPFSNRGRNAWTNYCYAKAWAKVEAFVREQQWDEPLLWVYPPHAFVHYAAMTWKGTRICVDLVDDNAQVSSMPETLRESYRRVYRDVLSRAEVVFAVSDDLLRRYDVPHERGICVSNGFSYGSSIATGWQNPPLPAGPRACYVGRIDDRLDLDLISHLANENSDVQFIFVGPIEPHFRKQWNVAMGHRANVHTWGTVSHLDMGAVLREMDVCLLPHRDNSLTRSMDPLKLYVYLSYGKPVVATMARIAPDLEAFVRRASTADEFSAALRVALKNRNAVAPDLSEHLWEKRVRQMRHVLCNKPADLVVSVVHYNTPALLQRCLQSLAEEGSDLRKKVVVVDNASTPPLSSRDLEAFPDVELVSNTKNRGFGAANNQVLRSVRADVYVVINPDIVVSPGSLKVLYDRLHEDSQLGILGVRLRYPNGELQASCRRYPTLRSVFLRGLLSEKSAARFASIRRYLMLGETPNEPHAVDWVLGSCLAMRRDTVEAVGGFDENYFMYYEDIDLCYRVKKLGLKIEYYPRVEWVHDYRRESTKGGHWKLRRQHFQSAMRFLHKHLSDRGVLQSV